MIEYDSVRRRMGEDRRAAARRRLAAEAQREGPVRLRTVLGAGFARLALRLAGPATLRELLGEAR